MYFVRERKCGEFICLNCIFRKPFIAVSSSHSLDKAQILFKKGPNVLSLWMWMWSVSAQYVMWTFLPKFWPIFATFFLQFPPSFFYMSRYFPAACWLYVNVVRIRGRRNVDGHRTYGSLPDSAFFHSFVCAHHSLFFQGFILCLTICIRKVEPKYTHAFMNGSYSKF